MEAKESRAQPFLRWTGSKRWFIAEHLEEMLPDSFNNYFEPFLGAGSVFFYLMNKERKNNHNFYLSDSNEELINAYYQIQNNLTRLVKCLGELVNSKEEYYKIRNLKTRSNVTKAARFIYLNRTSFNGIYRVNSNNEYNVPYGNRARVDVVTKDLLHNVNQSLQGIHLKSSGFYNIQHNIKERDLVFLDPPYTVAHENNGFIEYNQRLFSWTDQKRLKILVERIIDRGAYFILTNASHPSIIDLYGNLGTIKKVSRPCKVGGRTKTRGVYNEVIIYNTRT